MSSWLTTSCLPSLFPGHNPTTEQQNSREQQAPPSDEEIAAANQELRDFLARSPPDFFSRAENDELSQLTKLIERQFGTLSEARNVNLFNNYKRAMKEAREKEAVTAKKRSHVNAKRAVIIATIVIGLLAAAGLSTGVVVLTVAAASSGITLPIVATFAYLGTVCMPVAYDLAKPLYIKLGNDKERFDIEKRTYVSNQRKALETIAMGLTVGLNVPETV